MEKKLTVVILAAGAGTRMKSKDPKPLQRFAGSTILEHIMQTVTAIKPMQTLIVYGKDKDKFTPFTKEYNTTMVQQDEQLGTGHAVLSALPFVKGDIVLVICGDTPLIVPQTLEDLLDKSESGMGLVTANVSNPMGLGRIIRDKQGMLKKIIEEKDANDLEKQISEISSGIICSPTKFLKESLPQINNDNSQKEYYLPEIIPLWLKKHSKITTVSAVDPTTVRGINTFEELAELESYFSLKVARELMKKGVRITKPETLIVTGKVTAEPGVVIDNNVVLRGNVSLKSGAHIHANCILEDVTVAENAHIKPNTTIIKSSLDKNAIVGPYAYIRPNCKVSDNAKIGAFVEAKNTEIGQNSKANHLSYLGDTKVGCNVNIGAGTITCNYDGTRKFKTTINDNSFIGSGSQLVAPITIAINSYIAAGSCVTKDTKSNSLTIARSRQKTIENWSQNKETESL